MQRSVWQKGYGVDGFPNQLFKARGRNWSFKAKGIRVNASTKDLQRELSQTTLLRGCRLQCSLFDSKHHA